MTAPTLIAPADQQLGLVRVAFFVRLDDYQALKIVWNAFMGVRKFNSLVNFDLKLLMRFLMSWGTDPSRLKEDLIVQLSKRGYQPSVYCPIKKVWTEGLTEGPRPFFLSVCPDPNRMDVTLLILPMSNGWKIVVDYGEGSERLSKGIQTLLEAFPQGKDFVVHEDGTGSHFVQIVEWPVYNMIKEGR